MVPQTVSDTDEQADIRTFTSVAAENAKIFGIVTVKNRSLNPPAELFIARAQARDGRREAR
jgi:hypothetical protein